MSLSDELRSEIEKWSKKLEHALSSISHLDDSGSRLLENIRAYYKDSQHFLNNGDLIRSFECLIWAWAFLEIGTQLGHLRSSKKPF